MLLNPVLLTFQITYIEYLLKLVIFSTWPVCCILFDLDRLITHDSLVQCTPLYNVGRSTNCIVHLNICDRSRQSKMARTWRNVEDITRLYCTPMCESTFRPCSVITDPTLQPFLAHHFFSILNKAETISGQTRSETW